MERCLEGIQGTGILLLAGFFSTVLMADEGDLPDLQMDRCLPMKFARCCMSEVT